MKSGHATSHNRISAGLRRHARRWLPAIVALASGCSPGGTCGDMHFDRFATADRVVASAGSAAISEPITDAATIRALTTFALAHSEGWSIRATGPPVARLSAEFYQGAEFLGDFGVGATFASAQGCGYFQTRDLSPGDAAEFARLLGTNETAVE